MKLTVIVKYFIFAYLILQFGLEGKVTYPSLTILLILIALQVWKEKYNDSNYNSYVTLLLTALGTYIDLRFGILFAIPLFDFVIKRTYSGLILTIFPLIYFLYREPHFYLLILVMTLIGLLGYVSQLGKEKESQFTATLDNERRLRYELEQAKAQLLHSSREIASIAEIKERNRIAREIHDSIGHSIAGILIQLQAAYKLYQKDGERSLAMIQQSIDSLANSVELIRNTVHNIKPQQNLGIAYIQTIIDQYHFAPVELKTTGDFNTLPAHHLEIMSATVKEALTNTARYSQATKVEIAIDINSQFTRLMIKDNGVGSKKYKEGLGISGMRERVRNIGGSFSISSDQGFLIVSILPREKGSEIFAGFDRR